MRTEKKGDSWKEGRLKKKLVIIEVRELLPLQ